MAEQYLTVTALTRYIKRKFEVDQHLSTVWLKAEISNFKHHSRGHMYFTLKDDQARILAVMFAGHNRNMKFEPENGMTVIVKGEVSVYEPQGQYQLYVQEMIPDGVGALHLAFEQLKTKLAAEGLFANERKKVIPKFPDHVAIITSETGAAVRDVLITLSRRYQRAQVSIFPTLVQGSDAKFSLVKRIKQANLDSTIDVIILARGGGSIEELWSFNEEMVARAIAESRIPIISGVGHETDTTITDFVADLRAPTPTGAAELAVPVQGQIQQQITQLRKALDKEILNRIETNKSKLTRLGTSYAFKYPQQLISQKEQELDRLMERLQVKTEQILQHKEHQFKAISSRLNLKLINQEMKQLQQQKEFLMKAIEVALKNRIQDKKNLFSKKLDKLDMLSPLSIMKRGYALNYQADGTLIKSVKAVQPGDQITVKLQDGTMDCQVWGIEEE
ncbi:Exodeoxyribonuclease VII large subunit [Amphibacillus marinus]|uniref:Exodeoxyribonuclease 7 large subunit n=1 Tax=Amphibacillus marinus TaxID=872970 RepID=A0A1H8NLF4_9BACI|nr:exodeoxyribonuclease VII large subunit [Amphibacillus marinus]SEO30238.1 Exodeoxyribonuclease VII large subunit [Amphibacillus marinus]